MAARTGAAPETAAPEAEKPAEAEAAKAPEADAEKAAEGPKGTRRISAAAQEALGKIDKNSITELKSLAKPPEGVAQLLGVVMILCGEDPKKTEWKDVGRFLSNPSAFLEKCENLDPSEEQINAARAAKEKMGDMFSADEMKRKSKACECLVLWLSDYI